MFIFINLISGEECKKTGEKFQPIGGKKKNYDMEEESNEDEAGSDVDSLSDLYPGSISSTNVVQSVGVCVLHH